MNRKTNLLIVALIVFITSCKKEPDQISGYVLEKIYDNDYMYYQKTVPAVDYDIFLCEANNSSIIDRVRASYDGKYLFDNLKEGTYRVFVLSDDTSFLSPTINITSPQIKVEPDKVAYVDTLYVFKGIGITKGNATIKGRLWVINYKKNGYEIKDISVAQEMEVYLIYGNHASFDERVRTNYDGYFEFRNLIKGDYVVYAYSEQEDEFGDLTGATEKVAKKKYIKIETDNQIIEVTDTLKIF